MIGNRLVSVAGDHEQNLLQEQFDSLEGRGVWQVGACRARDSRRGAAVYELRDSEGASYWLRFGPWSDWERVGTRASHLHWINEVLVGASPLFKMMGNLFAPVSWTGMEEGYLGICRQMQGRPFSETFSSGRPPRLENMIQMTGFLRLLQTGRGRLSAPGEEEIRAFVQDAGNLADRAEDMIPAKTLFRNWKSFYLQNTRTLASFAGRPLTLSLGAGAASCFTSGPTGSLVIDYPFLLHAAPVHSDLCRILYEWTCMDDLDRQCLINLYFNLQPPSYFFTLMAQRHMTFALEDITITEDNPAEHEKALDRFAQLARTYDLFRMPVPGWYE